jgi:hypothetical protein
LNNNCYRIRRKRRKNTTLNKKYKKQTTEPFFHIYAGRDLIPLKPDYELAIIVFRNGIVISECTY